MRGPFAVGICTAMGVAPSSLSSRKLSDKPRMTWQTRMYWHESKRRLEKYVSQRILQEGDGFHLLLRLYALFGGSSEQSSPICVKGGTAAWLYLKQQTVWLSTVLPSASLQVASPVDFDFDSMLSPASTLANSVRAIHSMRQLVSTNVSKQTARCGRCVKTTPWENPFRCGPAAHWDFQRRCSRSKSRTDVVLHREVTAGAFEE